MKILKLKLLNLLLNHIILLVNHYMLNNNIIKGIITLIYIKPQKKRKSKTFPVFLLTFHRKIRQI